MSERNMQLEISKLIGEPISNQLPVPVEIAAICDTFTAEPGEHVWRYTNIDKDADYILDVDADGKITVVKKTVMGDTELTFKHLDSRLEYVLIKDVLDNPDTSVLSRKKEAIIRGMDKSELYILLTAIEGGTDVTNNQGVQSVTASTGDDLYDLIMDMKHLVEDYGDGYVLLCGTTVKEKIDTYDKDNVTTFNYNITLFDRLKALGIDVMKIFGKVDRGSGEVALLNASHMILVAKNSRLAEGKPIKFIRRKITPDLAKLMGADIDKAQRAVFVNPTPVMQDFSGTSASLLGYACLGYESFIFAICNALAIVKCDASLAVA